MAWDDWIRTVEIEPAIDAVAAAARERQVETLLRSGCRIFHVDGATVDPTNAVALLAPMVHRYDGVIDVHAPAGGFMILAAAGADSVTFDANIVANVAGAIAEAREAGVQVGIAFDETATPKEVAAVGNVDLVLCACRGEEGPGHVAELAEAIPESVTLQVEGDITHENLVALHAAGARVFVVDDAIFVREDLPRAYRRLVQALA